MRVNVTYLCIYFFYLLTCSLNRSPSLPALDPPGTPTVRTTNSMMSRSPTMVPLRSPPSTCTSPPMVSLALPFTRVLPLVFLLPPLHFLPCVLGATITQSWNLQSQGGDVYSATSPSGFTSGASSTDAGFILSGTNLSPSVSVATVFC
jgi:hypothetical protein